MSALSVVQCRSLRFLIIIMYIIPVVTIYKSVYYGVYIYMGMDSIHTHRHTERRLTTAAQRAER